MAFDKFEHRFPSGQTAVEVFAGKWASDLSAVCAVTGTGTADLFVSDPRPKMAAEALGARGYLDGMHILELGPLEAAHSYQLERLGAASVLGIEANVEAYLKCLIVKELLDLRRCRFMLGDVVEFASKTKDRFEMVFCSGIIYHMEDPMALIKAICGITDKCFVWTHFYEAEHGDKEGKRVPRIVDLDGFQASYYELDYENRYENGTFWGGNTDRRAWMTRDALLDCFRHFGMTNVTVLQETPEHQHGAAMTFVASRS